MEGNSKDNQLFGKVAELIEIARKKVATTVNLKMVHTYFEIGRMIVEDEQQGKERAAYGKAVLKDLSFRLKEKFGKGFSVEKLDRMRFFYKTYSSRISSTPLTKLENPYNHSNTIQQNPSGELQDTRNLLNTIGLNPSSKTRDFTLSWSHYLILMRIESSAERNFYEIEALSQNWSEAQLKRQYHSSLNERLALSPKLAKEIEPECGSGFSYRQLNWSRQIYRTFPITNAVRTQLNAQPRNRLKQLIQKQLEGLKYEY